MLIEKPESREGRKERRTWMESPKKNEKMKKEREKMRVGGGSELWFGGGRREIEICVRTWPRETRGTEGFWGFDRKEGLTLSLSLQLSCCRRERDVREASIHRFRRKTCRERARRKTGSEKRWSKLMDFGLPFGCMIAKELHCML